MELGQKLRAARMEAGLSQRQLCGDVITRNMLSQIENGSARPSMDTLRYLSARLGKSVSYFLEEQAITSPNQTVMAQARTAFSQGDYKKALELLEEYLAPDAVFDQEHGLLLGLSLMALAEKAMAENRLPYARELLGRAVAAGNATAYFGPELERRRLLLLSQAAPETVCEIAAALPADDRELLLRAKAAAQNGDHIRCAQLLDAAEIRSDAWFFLRGQAHLAMKEYPQAIGCLHKAEKTLPLQTAPLLEECYRETGDFKRAYEYACKQK